MVHLLAFYTCIIHCHYVFLKKKLQGIKVKGKETSKDINGLCITEAWEFSVPICLCQSRTECLWWIARMDLCNKNCWRKPGLSFTWNFNFNKIPNKRLTIKLKAAGIQGDRHRWSPRKQTRKNMSTERWHLQLAEQNQRRTIALSWVHYWSIIF